MQVTQIYNYIYTYIVQNYGKTIMGMALWTIKTRHLAGHFAHLMLYNAIDIRDAKVLAYICLLFNFMMSVAIYFTITWAVH